MLLELGGVAKNGRALWIHFTISFHKKRFWKLGLSYPLPRLCNVEKKTK